MSEITHELPEEDLAEQVRIEPANFASWLCENDAANNTTRAIVGEADAPPTPDLTAGALRAHPEHSGGHPGFLALLEEMRLLHLKKAADYGRGVDPLANCRSAAEFGIPPWVGVMVRLGDKMHRIKSFLQNGKLENESITDSLMDLAAYALIALTLYREEHV